MVVAVTKSRKIGFLFFAVSAFGGCAQHTWTPGPGLRLSDFEPAKAECSLMARNGGSGFIAYGQASYVAGAALGHAIGESIRAQANFNDCLSAKGWRKTTPESLAASQVKTEIVKAAATVSRECIANVRNQDRYTPIQLYFTDPKTGKHSVVQLSNDRRATPVEAKFLSGYIDDIGPCLDRRHAEYEKASPEGAEIARQGRRAEIVEALLLIKGQLTWGTYSARADEATDAFSARLKQVSF